jgi:hypothetical protein
LDKLLLWGVGKKIAGTFSFFCQFFTIVVKMAQNGQFDDKNGKKLVKKS